MTSGCSRCATCPAPGTTAAATAAPRAATAHEEATKASSRAPREHEQGRARAPPARRRASAARRPSSAGGCRRALPRVLARRSSRSARSARQRGEERVAQPAREERVDVAVGRERRRRAPRRASSRRRRASGSSDARRGRDDRRAPQRRRARARDVQRDPAAERVADEVEVVAVRRGDDERGGLVEVRGDRRGAAVAREVDARRRGASTRVGSTSGAMDAAVWVKPCSTTSVGPAPARTAASEAIDGERTGRPTAWPRRSPPSRARSSTSSRAAGSSTSSCAPGRARRRSSSPRLDTAGLAACTCASTSGRPASSRSGARS